MEKRSRLTELTKEDTWFARRLGILNQGAEMNMYKNPPEFSWDLLNLPRYFYHLGMKS